MRRAREVDRRTFLAETAGTLAVANRDLPETVARLREAVSDAYAEKYPTKGSERWVRGFAEETREATTLELSPR